MFINDAYRMKEKGNEETNKTFPQKIYLLKIIEDKYLNIKRCLLRHKKYIKYKIDNTG